MPERNEDVRVHLRGQEYTGWGDLEITRTLDSFSTLGFAAPFEPEQERFREDFRPFSFHDLDVTVGGEPLFTGTLNDVDPSTVPDSRTVGVSAYARPGVLAFCHMPPSSWPLEFNGLNLQRIAERLGAPWNLGVLVDGGDVGAAFDRLSMEPDADPYAFLTDIAQQRGFVVADHPDGRIWLRRSATDAAPIILRLTEGEPPLMSVGVAFSPREYFSEITAIGGARAGRPGASATVQNPHARALRPRCYKPDDTEAGDVPAASRAQLGRMFGAAVTYEVPLPTWRNPQGVLWEPNQVVTLEAPGAMVYRPTRMIVRTVSLKKSASEQSAVLGLVLPGVFTSEAPEVEPWA